MSLDLNRMYKLFLKVDKGLQTIIDAVSAHLQQEGKRIVDSQEHKNAILFIEVGVPCLRMAYMVIIFIFLGPLESEGEIRAIPDSVLQQ